MQTRSVEITRSDPPGADTGTLEVEALRRINYRVYNSKLPVFDVGNSLISRVLESRPVFVVVDDVVMKHYGRALAGYFRKNTNLVRILSISGNESCKQWDTVHALCVEASRAQLDRSAVFVAVGGGVALDVGGMAAALYRRGVRFVRIATTLLGIVDVAVGIKHGFNFHGKKNLLGAFYPPMASIADRSLIKTCRRRDIACGVAEIVKMGIACDADIIALLERGAERLLESRFQQPVAVAEEIIERAQRTMIAELCGNLFEDDLRRCVDYGHTFSPSIEAASNYEVKHGEAVAIDMLLSAAIAMLRGLLTAGEFVRVCRLYDAVGLPKCWTSLSVHLLRDAIEDARRHRGGDLNLVIPVSIGRATFVQDVTFQELSAALDLVHRADVPAE